MFSQISNELKCQILLGNWLGDATFDNRGHWLISKHSLKQYDYCKWLYYLYENMKLEVNFNKCVNYKSNIQNNYEVSIIKCKIPLPTFFDDFYIYDNTNLTKSGNITYYRKKQKIITPKLLSLVTHPMTLLLWYLDDGSLSVIKRFKKDGSNHGIQRQAYLATNGFTFEENELIKNHFKSQFNIDLKIYKQRSQNINDPTKYRITPILYFNSHNFRKFYDIVRPYLYLVPHSMSYKFNMKYEINKRLNSKYLSENYNFNY